jgi:flavin reductase (DIM6/NTAB) family NADH-FMN oxidoreductase RutF
MEQTETGLQQVLLDGSHDSRQLRNALGLFATGVTVITTRGPAGKLEGLTANSFSALSLDPPLVLWSLSRRSPSMAGFMESGYFAINVLGAGQSALSHHFATPQTDKFAGLELAFGLGGIPLLPDVLARFECRTHSTIDGGDHVLFVGRVHKVAYGAGQPLVFNAGRYCTAVALRKEVSAESDLNSIWGGLG